MADIWNSWEVKPPPVCTVKTPLQSKELKSLNQVVNNAVNVLNDMNHLNKEAAILSRYLYKNKRTYRHDKSNQLIVQVYQCLKRYLKLNMVGVFTSFKESLPYEFSVVTTHVYLPTKQMLRWLLLRLQSFSKIFARLIELTKKAAIFIEKKSFLGWTLQLNLFIYSIAARILATSKYLVTKSIEWYNTLYKHLPFLKQTAEFLPNYSFPPDLKLWLGEVDLSPLKKKFYVDKIFDMIRAPKSGKDDGDDDEDVEIINANLTKSKLLTSFLTVGSDVEVEDKSEEEEEEEVQQVPQASMTEDIGVSVNAEQDEVRRPLKKKRKMNEKSKKFKKFKKYHSTNC